MTVFIDNLKHGYKSPGWYSYESHIFTVTVEYTSIHKHISDSLNVQEDN